MTRNIWTRNYFFEKKFNFYRHYRKMLDDGSYEKIIVKKPKNYRNESYYIMRYNYFLKNKKQTFKIKDKFIKIYETVKLYDNMDDIIKEFDINNKKTDLINTIQDLYI